MKLDQITESPLCGNISGSKTCISKSLRALVFMSLLSIAVLPAYIFFFVSPSFHDLLIGNPEHESVHVASHLSSHFIPGATELTRNTVPLELKEHGNEILNDLGIWKLKLLSPTGEIIHSSDPKDIGQINNSNYFSEIVANGKTYIKQGKKDVFSLEGQSVPVDIIETSVPIIRENRFIGAFEIYYDISEVQKKFNNLTFQAYIVLSAISIFIFLAVIKISLKARKNIIDRKHYEETLHQVAMTDELTGLLNRRGFFVMAENQINMSERMGKRNYLLYADIDNLKEINDNLGHKTGDEAIVETAEILQKTFRKTDILSRLGGDEFAVLMTCDPDEGRNETAARRLQENLRLLNEETLGREYQLHVSTGVFCCSSKSPCSIDELVSHADLLMYESKKNKRNPNSYPLAYDNNSGCGASYISFIHHFSDFYPAYMVRKYYAA